MFAWRSALRDRTAPILALALLVHVIGIGWGLPASDGWDNDGIAPRDFLTGIVESYSSGSYFTYPPLHLLVLGVLTSPVSGYALAHAPSMAPPDVVAEMIKVPYMTAIAYVARAVTVLMSVGIVYAVAKIAEELRGPRAALLAAAVCVVNAPFAYYSHTTNLDVPYLFWACLALLALTRAIARREPRRLRHAMVLAALAIATKDQAYALFVLGVPAALALWAWIDPWPRANARAVARDLAIGVALAAALLALVDGAVVNPSGFAKRLAFLIGPASQDFVTYTRDPLGRALAFRDSLFPVFYFYPAAVFALVALGVLLVVLALWRRTGQPSARAAAFVPLAALLSFTLLFNCTALRTEHRFVLPQMILFAVYAGVGVDRLFLVPYTGVRLATIALFAGTLAMSAFQCAAVDASLLFDPRYDAEAWMRAHVAPGDTIETYGLNVYLPRFPAGARVVRVGPSARRNPLFGVDEAVGLFGDAEKRAPRWIVVSERWAGRYLTDAPKNAGHVMAPTVAEDQKNSDAATFFRALFQEQRGFKLAHKAEWRSALWPRVDIHGALDCEVWIFERRS